MLHTFISSLLNKASNDYAAASRRTYPRREMDRCVCVMYGRTFPVYDWSFGGALVVAEERMFSIGQDIETVFKFKLHSAILDVSVKGEVVRKASGMIGIKFEPITQAIRRNFQQVVDDSVAQEFANSQA